MDVEQIFVATAQQRRAVAELIDGLDDAQLEAPSLCEGWTIKTVAAHLLSNVMDGRELYRLTLHYRSPHRAMDELARRRAQSPAGEIADDLRRFADRRYKIFPPHAERGPLADVLVHSGDIKIPLGLPFEPDRELAAVAMDRLTQSTPTGLVPLNRARGICWRASDVDRSWRKGQEICGPVAALMMAIGGRPALFDQLEGPGLALLRHRLFD